MAAIKYMLFFFTKGSNISVNCNALINPAIGIDKRGEKLFLLDDSFHKRIKPSFDPEQNTSECGMAAKEQIQLLVSEP
jgi:hypothetical protein